MENARIFRSTLAGGLLFVALAVTGQTNFQKTKWIMDGFGIQLGVVQTSFLNSQFSSFAEEGRIGTKVGFTGGVTYVVYPLIFDLNYFNVPFEVSGHQWNYPDKTKVHHRGVEAGLSLALLPNWKKLQPYVGGLYQSAQLGAGIGLSEEEKKLELDISSVNVSGVSLRTGLIFNLSAAVGIRADYKRSLNTSFEGANHNQLTITAILRPELSKMYN